MSMKKKTQLYEISNNNNIKQKKGNNASFTRLFIYKKKFKTHTLLQQSTCLSSSLARSTQQYKCSVIIII